MEIHLAFKTESRSVYSHGQKYKYLDHAIDGYLTIKTCTCRCMHTAQHLAFQRGYIWHRRRSSRCLSWRCSQAAFFIFFLDLQRMPLEIRKRYGPSVALVLLQHVKAKIRGLMRGRIESSCSNGIFALGNFLRWKQFKSHRALPVISGRAQQRSLIAKCCPMSC